MIKKIGATFIIFAWILSSSSISASAEPSTITVLTDIFHREANGKFTDDSLGESISYFGDLYKKVSDAPKRGIWVIDPQLIEEIIDMSDGYTVLPNEAGKNSESAKNFLALVKAIIGESPIFALPYGSPNLIVRRKISDVELSQIQNISALRLARALDVSVSAGLPESFTPTREQVSLRARNSFAIIHKTLNRIGLITSDPEVAEVALRSNALLNPRLPTKKVQYLAISLNGTADRLEKKVKVLPGKYTLTSTNEKIPVTIVNDFSAPAEVVLILHAENARIVIDTAKKVTLAKNSRKQVLIDAKAVANGKVRVEARLETSTGARYGESNSLQFSISMLGPVITWVMAGAGILLVGASGIQITRRLRRGGIDERR